jgi:hypothetical protein
MSYDADRHSALAPTYNAAAICLTNCVIAAN